MTVSSPTTAPPTPLRIVLTGFMGSGKSTVGPLVAAALGWRFVDADHLIEHESGLTIAQIFARFGEPHFRQVEQSTIARLATEPSLVLALGGGAIEAETTRQLLLNTPGTLLVHLQVSLSTALTRCGHSDPTRPVLADQAALEGRYLRRLPLYRQAHLNLEVDPLAPADVVERILQAIGL